jgi:hypothetical protein
LAFRDFSLLRTHFQPFTEVVRKIRREVTRKVQNNFRTRLRRRYGVAGRGLPRAAPPQPKFSPRMTRMNANRKNLCSISRSFGSATQPARLCAGLRVALDRTKHGKRCEGVPHSKSPAIAGRNPLMIRVNWRDSRAKNLRKARRFWPIVVRISRIEFFKRRKRKIPKGLVRGV